MAPAAMPPLTGEKGGGGGGGGCSRFLLPTSIHPPQALIHNHITFEHFLRLPTPQPPRASARKIQSVNHPSSFPIGPYLTTFLSH